MPILPTVLGGNLLRGCGLSWMLISAITIVQHRTPPALMGRAASALYLLLLLVATLLCALTFCYLVTTHRSRDTARTKEGTAMTDPDRYSAVHFNFDGC